MELNLFAEAEKIGNIPFHSERFRSPSDMPLFRNENLLLFPFECNLRDCCNLISSIFATHNQRKVEPGIFSVINIDFATASGFRLESELIAITD